jgi:hypothetical protein
MITLFLGTRSALLGSFLAFECLPMCGQFRAAWRGLSPGRDMRLWNDGCWRHDLGYGMDLWDRVVGTL